MSSHADLSYSRDFVRDLQDENERLREALEYQEPVLRQLDVKIGHSLHVATVEQMFADLQYLQRLLWDMHHAILKALAAR